MPRLQETASVALLRTSLFLRPKGVSSVGFEWGHPTLVGLGRSRDTRCRGEHLDGTRLNEGARDRSGAGDYGPVVSWVGRARQMWLELADGALSELDV